MQAGTAGQGGGRGRRIKEVTICRQGAYGGRKGAGTGQEGEVGAAACRCPYRTLAIHPARQCPRYDPYFPRRRLGSYWLTTEGPYHTLAVYLFTILYFHPPWYLCRFAWWMTFFGSPTRAPTTPWSHFPTPTSPPLPNASIGSHGGRLFLAHRRGPLPHPCCHLFTFPTLISFSP